MSEPVDLPPPIPPAEMPDDELAALVDAGNVEALERALREQAVRFPSVLREFDRILENGLGNLGAAIATMLIDQFHITQANRLAERVLLHAETAGVEELTDLAAALIQQERKDAAIRVLETALAKNPSHDRALYLRARLHARKGDFERAFATISRANPDVIGVPGLAAQALYAALTARDKAYEGAMKRAEKIKDPESKIVLTSIKLVHERVLASQVDVTKIDLRTAFALQFGSFVVETSPNGRFGTDAMTFGEVGALIFKIRRLVERITPKPNCFYFASEDGEILAAGLAKMMSRPSRAWRKDAIAQEGDWLCLGSAGTHPHVPHDAVATLDDALRHGVLRTIALVLPSGCLGPIVPDIIGRIAEDDEFPWRVDDEVDDVYAEILSEAEIDLTSDDDPSLNASFARFERLLRATQTGRTGHVPYTDELCA